ncbi:MAG TPA: hypothetical protein VIS26_05255 [Candidatus Limnocylindria bacterium]|jgi:hypothetical protein
MPFNWRDKETATTLSREAHELGRLIGKIPLDRKAPAHPEIGVALRAFERINAILAKAAKTDTRIVTEAQKVRIGGHFEKMGKELQKRSRARRKR